LEELTTGDIRGLVVDSEEERLYALSRIPSALVVMDISEEDGEPRNEILDAVDVCLQPSNVKLRRTSAGWLLAYVVCWATGQVYVVDPGPGEVVSVIPVGSGPHDLVFTPDYPWIPEELRSLGFVSNFAENTVSIIDLDSESPTWNRVIGRLGFTEKAVDQ